MVGEGRAGPRLIQQQLPLGLIAGVYGVMSVVALGLAWWLLDALPIIVGPREAPIGVSVALGLVFGLVVVRASDLLTARSPAMRRMALKLQSMIGHVPPMRAALIGLLSGVGEELLFRGFLFPYLALLAERWGSPEALAWVCAAVVSSLIFGFAHQSGDKDLGLWPWFAFVVGVGFAALTWWTGAVIAAVVAHCAINTFNLLALQDVRAT